MKILLSAAALTMFAGFASRAIAQQTPDVAAQRAAMKKLEFLVGKWSGPATVSRGPGEPIKITQTEAVRFAGGELVLLVEGNGTNADGKLVFSALATISYDDSTSTYRFRAHSDGRFLDVPLTVAANGFSWGYDAGPLKVVNTMILTADGAWSETTESTYGSTPPRKSVEMRLRHLQ